ncbi:hypothetical protein [Lentibacillus salicampi]|uniref:Uncharacterized protein n=1 Tax=Lentibacillus salicampi TaxID=175306 RepID=A0A4Y9AHQ7_9BACI|nr:hypothetical protein [Lentibacillus salicampi]TFJ94490.1 hypothetical protein E4U82_00800 [Lentibacillus salicampi]
MTIELEDFLYELKNYTEQTHIFKDAYERLTPTEREKVSAIAPFDGPMPDEAHQKAVEWLRQMQKNTE